MTAYSRFSATRALIGMRDPRLRWAPPAMVSPGHVYLTNATKTTGILDPTKDFYVHLPNEPIAGITIEGGRNVVLIGGHIRFETNLGTTNSNRAGFIKGRATQTQPRVIHIEGVKLSGYLTEGFDFDGQSFNGYEPATTLRFQNIDCADLLRGTQATNHADLIQVYNGPTNLQMDRVYGLTQYQMLMLQPRQNGSAPMGIYDLSRCFFEGTDESGSVLYCVTATAAGIDRPTIVTDRVFVRGAAGKSFPSQVISESPDLWGSGVFSAPQGMSKPVTGAPGLNYVSPGYLAA